METTCRGVAPWVDLPPVVVFRALRGLDGRGPERILNICCDGPTSEAYIAVNAQQRVGGGRGPLHLASISEMASRNDDINDPGRTGNGKEPPTGIDVRYDDMGILGLPWQGKIGHEASQCHRLRRCPMPHIARLDTDRGTT